MARLASAGMIAAVLSYLLAAPAQARADAAALLTSARGIKRYSRALQIRPDDYSPHVKWAGF